MYVCDDPACASGIKHTLVTTADVVGHFTSVMIGVDSNPFIRHQNQTDGDLELAVPVVSVTGIVFE